MAECREQKKNLAPVDLVELAAYTGMRQGELLGLTCYRVDRSRGVVLLEVTKSGRRREVPLNGPADAVLDRRASSGTPEGLVFGTRSWYAFRNYWEAAVAAAHLGDFRFHDLRHTFASWAVQRGATLQEVKDLLGHSSLAMVMRYAHPAPSTSARPSPASKPWWRRAAAQLLEQATAPEAARILKPERRSSALTSLATPIHSARTRPEPVGASGAMTSRALTAERALMNPARSTP